MRRISFILLMALFSVLGFNACETPSISSCATSFDQLGLLSNIGNNIILPVYQELATQSSALQTAINTFADNPNNTTLGDAQTKLKAAWTAWQKAGIFEFGPAADENLRSFMNNFPVFVTRLEDAVDAGSYDLNSETYSFTRGFPALDYLLYGLGTNNADILATYVSANNSTNRQQYIKDVAALIAQKAQAVYDAWNPAGANYVNTFNTTEGVANGKPLSDLVNQLNQGYELFKNDQLGTPISAKTGYQPLLPQNVQAYYGGYSLDLALAAIRANKTVFEGDNGSGLDDYIAATGVKKGDRALNELITEQYDKAIASLEALQPARLQDAVQNDIEAVKTAYANAQNQVILLKTDMPSALCISITYIDNVDDGD